MAREIDPQFQSGAILYAVLWQKGTLVIWQGTTNTLVTYVNANDDNYDIPLIEVGNSGKFYADLPNHANLVNGDYTVGIFERSTGTPDLNIDQSLGEKEFYRIDGTWVDLRLALSDPGIGNVPVNHNTGGADNLRFMLGAVAVDDADVRAYLKSDYDAGRVSQQYIQAQTITGPVNQGDGFGAKAGRMPRPMFLTGGSGLITYTIVFNKPGTTQAATAEINV